MAKVVTADAHEALLDELDDLGEDVAITSGLIQEYAKERGVWGPDEIKELIEDIEEDYRKDGDEGN